MSLLISRRYCNKIFENTVQTTLKSDMGWCKWLELVI
jgi:hypothetical protein